nr:g1/s-specific cyclin pas1 [Quercus suber]
MNIQSEDQAFHGPHPTSLRSCGLYEPSIASTASSSQFSVFSDPLSAQSSIASSVSDDFPRSQEDATGRSCAQAQTQYSSQVDLADLRPSYADVTSASTAQKQHPRRNSLARNQRPPSLVRQCERKINFVDNLVDSATQMVEVIWPLAVIPCRAENSSGRGVLPLRTYIEETLRRSRTSYSTLQVALYYLILIKPFVPKNDFTMEQQQDCPATRALMCGRRMFLAALILASKYLQDRNYSAKAWSKMSGLKINEINTNEKVFLERVDWKLHIPESIFKRWTEVVLRYTPNMPPPSPSATSFCLVGTTWRSIVPILTPTLDMVPMPIPEPKPTMSRCPANYGPSPPTTPTPTPTSTPMPRTRSTLSSIEVESRSHETTPTPTTVLPRFMEPRPDLAPPTPALVRMGPLPTPTMTPSSVALSTPAASACDSRRPSMSHAMTMAQKASINRCINDTFSTNPMQAETYRTLSRRPSLASAASLMSSPESMVSDRSRSSRASSISSTSTFSTAASMAPGRACLARQATCRNVRLPAPCVKEENEGATANSIAIAIAEDAAMVSSPEHADFSISEKALSAPHRHSKRAPQPVSAPASGEKSRKRARPRGGRRSDLQEEVRYLLEEDLEAMMVEDLENASPSPAPGSACRPEYFELVKGVQPPATVSRRSPSRLPVQKMEGKKRTCCTVPAMSTSSSPAYGMV